ncbi:MAG: peptidase M14 [Verrucomicrobia bacterium]|nr:peptidase M14 [Verrucomicrobiota bacterium]
MKKLLRLLAAPLAAALPWAAPVCGQLQTHAEKTDYRETGRYEEVERLVGLFEQTYPQKVRKINFGKTPEGRMLWAVVASLDGTLTPADARSRNRPVFLFNGGIHAGEIDGKDAGFLALRHWLDGTVKDSPLNGATVVFVPVFNVDGHERFGPNHRPNQRGPAAMGWRVTGQNLNLNRDYLKADAPEMQSFLRLLREWDPILYADLHVTDGAKFQHDIAIIAQPTQAGPNELREEAKAMVGNALNFLKSAGHKPVDFYPAFEIDELPSSGISASPAPPRFSQGYWALQNRIGLLVETHSWRPYKERVRATYNLLLNLASQTAQFGANWRKAAGRAEAVSAALAGKKVALTWQNTKDSTSIDFLGYEYRRIPSEISGKLWTVYDEAKPQVWKMPLRQLVEPKLEVEAPRAGYVVHAAHADWVSARLALHGVRFERVVNLQRLQPADMETFRATKVTHSPTSYEGRTTTTVEGAWKAESREIPPGSLFVPITQANAPTALHLLEPLAPDSLVTWGMFNAVFEQKEYMEAYVTEEVARAMLTRDPKLKEEFETKLATDAAFAANASARLAFFYKRHPAYDERYNLYPIYRVAVPPK